LCFCFNGPSFKQKLVRAAQNYSLPKTSHFLRHSVLAQGGAQNEAIFDS